MKNNLLMYVSQIISALSKYEDALVIAEKCRTRLYADLIIEKQNKANEETKLKDSCDITLSKFLLHGSMFVIYF